MYEHDSTVIGPVIKGGSGIVLKVNKNSNLSFLITDHKESKGIFDQKKKKMVNKIILI